MRRRQEEKPTYRQQFAQDAVRILHSRAYTRYIDKTQVFSLVENDHITHRVLHVQLVSRIARTIGRFLRLNEDLIEAIALGHDIGHPPFGHEGETILSNLCVENGLPPFQHNIQSVRFLDALERKGRGWNLTLQVLDGILCHDGEIHNNQISPVPVHDFSQFDIKFNQKERNPKHQLVPGTLEGCVVRLADTIAYIDKDIEDAIILGLIKRSDIPVQARALLGETNGSIVYALVTDLLDHSQLADDITQSYIGFNSETANVLAELKAFNYQRIYLATETKMNIPIIRDCFRALFEHYTDLLANRRDQLPGDVDLMTDVTAPLSPHYTDTERVRDFIAGMTDNFFLKQAKGIGCRLPAGY
jgi:dGTPase